MASELVTNEPVSPHSSWLLFHLKQIANLAVSLADFPDHQALRDHLARAISEGIGAQVCSIHTVNDSGDTLEQGASVGLTNDVTRATASLEIGVEGGWWADAVLSRRALIVEDMDADARIHSLSRNQISALRDSGICSLWVFPMLTKSGAVLGVFTAYHRERLSPSRMEIELAELYLGAGAAALDNARLLNSERKFEADVEENRERYRLVVETARDSIFTVSLDGRITSLNPAFETITGWKREEWLGRPFAPLIHPEDLPRALRIFKATIGGQEPPSYELRVSTRSGEPLIGEFVSAPLRINNTVVGMLGIARDITQRRTAEDLLRASEERFSRAFNASPHPVTINSLPEGRYIAVNDSFYRVIGFEREEVIGRTILELGIWVSRKDAARVAELLATQTSLRDWETRFRLRNGEIHTFLVSSEVIEVDGQRCLLTVATDIHERKQAEAELRQSEDRFSKAFHANPNPMSITTLDDGRYLDVNDLLLKDTGYTRQEMVGRTTLELGLWDDQKDLATVTKLLNTRGSIHNMEACFRTKAGRVKVGLFSAEVIDLDGRKCVLASLNDITEHKRAEEELHASEERFFKAFNKSPQPMSIVSRRAGLYIDVNDSFLKASGHTREEVIGHSVRELGIWTQLDDHRAVLKVLDEVGSVRDMEAKFTTKDGETRVCLFSAELIDLAGRQCVLTTSNDITERKQKEDELELARRHWQSTFDAMADYVMLIDNEDRLIRANKTFYNKMGLTPETSIGRSIGELLHGENARNDLESCPICQLRGRGEHAVIELPAGQISDYPLYASVDPILNSAGARVGIVEVIRDLSDLYMARAEAERERISLTATIEQMAEGLIVCDPTSRVIHANQQAQEIFGYTLQEMQSDVNSRLPESRFIDLDGNIVAVRELPVQVALRERRTIENVRLWHNRRDQQRVLLSVTASPFFDDGGVVKGAVALVRDVTEQQREHDRLQQADKLRALGQLASGVAHNFNNALAAVIGYTQLAIRKASNHEVEKYLRVIEQSAQDAARMVERIHNFSRGRSRVEDFAPVKLIDVVRDAIDITRPRWQHDAEAQGIKYDTALNWQASSEVKVSGRPSELREVFVNVIFNALDAMPPGGRIDISANEDGPFVNVGFSDTGDGMTEETRRRVFEPFFTTKGTSGLGMGLSESYRIIERHGGRIDIDSRINKGTTFTIILPMEEAPAGAETEHPQPTPLARLKILVIDDEEFVRGALAETLVEEGHDVTQAGSGEEALKLLEQRDFDIVFTDLAMPRADGIAVAARIKEIKPATKVVLMSGYGEDKAYERIGDLNCVDGFVSKPFNFAEVHRVLGLLSGLE